MNENPGETPNPLNPNQEPVATPQPTNVSPVIASAPQAEQASNQPTPVETPTAQPTSGGIVESLDPTGRTMEKAEESVVPEKKKKTGLIVGIIIAAVVLIGGGVALALVLMNSNKTDAVVQAMSKLMSGDAPSNLAVTGTIDILSNDADSLISKVSVALDTDMIVSSGINTSTAVVTLTGSNNETYSIDFDEIYASSGDLYFKIDGVNDVLNDPGFLRLLSGETEAPSIDIDCIDGDEDCMPLEDSGLEMLEMGELGTEEPEIILEDEGLDYTEIGGGMFGVVQLIDGVWLRISTDEIGEVSDSLVSDNSFSCISNLVDGVDKNSNSLVELYNKNPFLTSTSENLTVSSKNDPIYKIAIDAEELVGFVNGVNNSSLSQDIYSCLNLESNASITEEDASEVISDLPDIYVEIDGNSNFTRLYTKTETEGGAEIIVDLSFAYPTNVNVSEPLEYVDFSEILQEIMQSMFNIPDIAPDEAPAELPVWSGE